jgi:hypothetical protein
MRLRPVSLEVDGLFSVGVSWIGDDRDGRDWGVDVRGPADDCRRGCDEQHNRA